jgi:flavin reductase (DIM6/NTAB) family NADH-FMN oxidoreductase RutF
VALQPLPTYPPDACRLAEYADAMSNLASGVALVTAWLDGRPWGLTVTSFASVSATPPTILVSLRSEIASAEALREGNAFGVAILAREQEPLARRASAPGRPKFLEPFTHAEPWSASPVVRGSLAHLDCEPSGSVDIADHTIFFGRVRAAAVPGGGAPLVYFRRAFGTHENTHTTARETTR